MSRESFSGPYLTSPSNETAPCRGGHRVRRMALAGLALTACFMPALMAAGAVRKMPPPLPKPKPAEYMRPGSGEPAESPLPESEAPVNTEPEAVEAPPAEVGAIVIPREKPVDLRK